MKRTGRPQPLQELVLVVAMACTGAPLAHGQVCAVNLDQDSIQGAVENPACATIFVSAGTFDESVSIGRSLTLAGSTTGQTTISGELVVSGVGVSATLSDLAVDGCFEEAFRVIAGATASSTNVSAVQGNDSIRCTWPPFFADDFEGGDTGRWSSSVGSARGGGTEEPAPRATSSPTVSQPGTSASESSAAEKASRSSLAVGLKGSSSSASRSVRIAASG